MKHASTSRKQIKRFSEDCRAYLVSASSEARRQHLKQSPELLSWALNWILVNAMLLFKVCLRASDYTCRMTQKVRHGRMRWKPSSPSTAIKICQKGLPLEILCEPLGHLPSHKPSLLAHRQSKALSYNWVADWANPHVHSFGLSLACLNSCGKLADKILSGGGSQAGFACLIRSTDWQ